jgi:hypothetical protein
MHPPAHFPGGVRAASFRFGSAPRLPQAPPTRNCPHSRRPRFQSVTWLAQLRAELPDTTDSGKTRSGMRAAVGKDSRFVHWIIEGELACAERPGYGMRTVPARTVDRWLPGQPSSIPAGCANPPPRTGGLAALRPPATFWHPSGMSPSGPDVPFHGSCPLAVQSRCAARWQPRLIQDPAGADVKTIRAPKPGRIGPMNSTLCFSPKTRRCPN